METHIDLEHMETIPVNIGGLSCNINRKKLGLLKSFDEIIPKYDETNGLHLCLANDTDVIYPLNQNTIRDMCIGLSNDYPSNEFFPLFLEKRHTYWLGLIEKLYARGFERPSPVQTVTIPELINNRDGLIQFKSGTGKTFAFLTGLLWNFEPEIKNEKGGSLQYIFMTSTHQIANQIYAQVVEIMPENTNIVLCIGAKKMTGGFNNTGQGGFNNTGNGAFRSSTVGTTSLGERPMTIREETAKLRDAQIIVCTIGKFYDYLVNKRIIPSLKYLKAFCVDEFDIIVTPKTYRGGSRNKNHNMDDVDQIGTIMEKLPSYTQRVFFSATVTYDTLKLTTTYFRKYSPEIGDPLICLLDTDDYTLDGIRQYYVKAETYAEKKEILSDLLKQLRIGQGLVFVNRIDTASDIKSFLDSQTITIPSVVFHANLSADERTKTYKDFKDNKFRLLIATDVLARGIDIQSINVVINFDMPRDLPTYIHRVGRSGRYGRKGSAITFVTVTPMMNEMLAVDEINRCSKSNEMIELPENIAELL